MLMTIDERLTRIENALISGGLMLPPPKPSIEEILRDLAAGDERSFDAYMKANKGRTDIWPFAPPGKRGRKRKDLLRRDPGQTG